MALAAVSVLLLMAGLAALITPAPYEGDVLVQIDEGHSVRLLDAVGAGLIFLGSVAAWGAGIAWQRRAYAP